MNRSQVLNSYRPTALAEVEQWAEAGLPELVLREMLQREETSPYAPPPPEYLWKALDQAGKRTSERTGGRLLPRNARYGLQHSVPTALLYG